MPFVSSTSDLFVVNSPFYRERIIDGIRYWIVPGVILAADVVMNGALVPEEEMSNFVEAWNGRPISIDHSSAINTPKPDVPVVGTFYNARWDEQDRKLKGEFWLIVKELQKTSTGRDIMKNIRSGYPINVSTGYWAEFEITEGEINGKKYQVTHRNIRPDHVAILLSDRGACSIDDGCGLGMNKSQAQNCLCGKHIQKEANMPKREFKLADLKKLLPGLFSENEDDEAVVEFDPTSLLSEEELSRLNAPTQNSDDGKDDKKVQTPAPQVPQELKDFANVISEMGGADGFRETLKGLQTFTSLAVNMQAEADKEKASILAQLKASGQSVYTENELKEKSLDELRKLAQFAIPSVNFMGMGAHVLNQEDKDAYVPAPDMLNWGKKKDGE